MNIHSIKSWITEKGLLPASFQYLTGRIELKAIGVQNGRWKRIEFNDGYIYIYIYIYIPFFLAYYACIYIYIYIYIILI